MMPNPRVIGLIHFILNCFVLNSYVKEKNPNTSISSLDFQNGCYFYIKRILLIFINNYQLILILLFILSLIININNNILLFLLLLILLLILLILFLV